jgi:hypothetical protein
LSRFLRTKEQVMLNKTSMLAGLAALFAAGAAQAQCVSCSYETYYQPVTVRHCEQLVPLAVVQPVITEQVVPVVSFHRVRRVHFVHRTTYVRHVRAEPVYHFSGYDARGYGYGFSARPTTYDLSYGLLSGR